MGFFSKVFKPIRKVFSGIGKAVGSAVSTVLGTKELADAQKEASRLAAQQAEASYNQAQQQINAAQAKEPDVDTIRESNAGQSATMLTGPAGTLIDEENKKKKTLLGGA